MKFRPFNKSEKSLFEKLGVNSVYMFGSRALGVENPRSDFDVAILFKDASRLGDDASSVYLAMYELFADYFKTKNNIDIVFLHRATGQLRYHVVRNGAVLFDADSDLRGKFEENVIIEHADFSHHRRQFENAILKRAA